VHEGITTGLKGGRLHLDDEDLETMQEAVENRAVVTTSSQFGRVAKLATAPINLAVSGQISALNSLVLTLHCLSSRAGSSTKL
jgi:hypothetical protein